MKLGLIINLITIITLSETQKKDVIQADKILNQFIITHDVEGASTMYADEFILTTSSGKIKSKLDMLSEIGLADLQFDVNETTDVAVRILESTAVLTGVLHQKGLYKKEAFDYKIHVTDTWVKVDGSWKLLAGHATLIK